MSRLWMTMMALTFVLLSSGCAVKSVQPAPLQSDTTSLYQALGNNAGVSAIIDGLFRRISTDTRIVHHFDETDIALFRERLIEHICWIADGDCAYHGESMEKTHQGLNITQADFDALVGHLIASMKEQHIPLATRNALLKRLAPMYSDITYH